MEFLNIARRKSVLESIGDRFGSRTELPQIPYSELIPKTRDTDMISVSFDYSPLIYFSNRSAEDEKFSTSMLFAGFTANDAKYKTNALKSSFMLFDITANSERAGYIFSKIGQSNFIAGFDEPFAIKGIALVRKDIWSEAPIIDIEVGLRFFNGRRGSVSNYTTVEGRKAYLGKAALSDRSITLTQSNPIFFEAWNPNLEAVQSPDPKGSMPKPNAPSGGIVLPSGKIISVRELACNDDFTDNNDC